MNRAILTAGAIAIAVAAGIFALPMLPVAAMHVSWPQLLVGAAALSAGVTVGAIVFSAMIRAPAKIGASELMGKRLNEIEGLIRPFPTEKVQPLSVRPETFARQLDTVRNPDKYRDKVITMSLRGNTKDGEPFNPVKLREIFEGLRKEEKFDHVILYDDHKEFIGYIPAQHARLAFIDPSAAEAFIARAITDIYSGSINQEDLRRIGGATRNDVISHNAKLSEAAERMGDGLIRQLIVLHDNYHRKPIGLIYANSLVALMGKGGTLKG